MAEAQRLVTVRGDATEQDLQLHCCTAAVPAQVLLRCMWPRPVVNNRACAPVFGHQHVASDGASRVVSQGEASGFGWQIQLCFLLDCILVDGPTDVCPRPSPLAPCRMMPGPLVQPTASMKCRWVELAGSSPCHAHRLLPTPTVGAACAPCRTALHSVWALRPQRKWLSLLATPCSPTTLVQGIDEDPGKDLSCARDRVKQVGWNSPLATCTIIPSNK